MAARFTLNAPHPDHEPEVGRRRTGTTWRGGQCYGTTLRCSCGWRPDDGRGFSPGKVSNEAPSAGGRAAALTAYRAHLLDVLPVADMDAGLYAEFLARLPQP